MSAEYDGYILIEYHIFKAKVIRENKKTYTVSVPPEPRHMRKAEVRRVSKDKYVPKATPFCVVWEMWKGVNGRGAHRLETTMYPDKLAVGGNRLIIVWEKDKP